MVAHGRRGLIRVAQPQRGDDLLVVPPVLIAPGGGGAAPLQVAPDPAVPGPLHLGVQPDQQRAAGGRDDRPVQRGVPDLELVVVGGPLAAAQAAVHLVEVPGRPTPRPGTWRSARTAGGPSSRRPARSHRAPPPVPRPPPWPRRPAGPGRPRSRPVRPPPRAGTCPGPPPVTRAPRPGAGPWRAGWPPGRRRGPRPVAARSAAGCPGVRRSAATRPGSAPPAPCAAPPSCRRSCRPAP